MSLKSFHIFFISVSILFFFGFGAWVLLVNNNGIGVWSVIGSLFCFGAGVLLILYGVKFLKKFKNVSFM